MDQTGKETGVSHQNSGEEQLHTAWQIFQHANEGILITNKYGIIQTINPATVRLFGYEPADLVGQTVEKLIPAKYGNRHENLRQGYFDNPYSRPMKMGNDLHGLRKDGQEIPLEISLSSFNSNGEIFAIAFIADRTELSRKEALLHKNQIELENLAKKLKIANSDLENRVKRRTQMLEETISELNDAQEQLRKSLEKEMELGDLKSKFASLVSHEFRTPLATILSSLNLIERHSKEGLNENQQNHVVRIKKAVQNMVDIINDLLTITRIEQNQLEIKPELFDLPMFLDAVRSDLLKFLRPGQQIHISAEGAGQITTDRNMLGQVLTNLVSNAIKFSPEGSDVKMSCTDQGDVFKIAVEDRGIGIPREELDRLYDSFFRASNAANIEGTGLGLFIVNKCVESLNGKVSIDSELGKGTTVSIVIPKILNEEKNSAD